MLMLMGDFNAKLGCEAQLWGGAIGRFGLPAPIIDNGTQLLNVCMANNLVVADTLFQHKPVHLQTWYSQRQLTAPNTRLIMSSKLFRIRIIIRIIMYLQCIPESDTQSDHRLMVCKLWLKFRKPAKHTCHPRLQPAPLHNEAGKAAFQLSMQDLLATHHHIPLHDVEHSWGALKSSLNTGGTTAQAQLKQASKPKRAWISEATLHHADCKRKLWQAHLVNTTLHSKAMYKVASRAALKSALADYNQHFTSVLTKVQQSMRKGGTHPAYQALRQLSKPKCQIRALI